MRLHDEAIERSGGPAPQGLDAADAEDEMLERLEDLDVPEAWKLAEPLASAGLDGEWAARLAEAAGPATGPALRWVAASLTAHNLACELLDSAERMGSLVGAVKTYAYMDRGSLVEADLHEGLDSTLVILGHKLKHTRIKVVRDYDPALPKLTVRGSELNQVWTNLIHNAIDALGDHGTITIRTRLDGECVQVDVADDGPGIPEDGPAARPRALLHDQGGRQRDRAGARHLPADRRGGPRRQHLVRHVGRRHDVPRAPAAAPLISAPAACAWPAAPARCRPHRRPAPGSHRSRAGACASWRGSSSPCRSP